MSSRKKVMGKTKRKNRSSDLSSNFQDSTSAECTGGSKQNKKQRSESSSGQKTLNTFITGAEKMTTREANKTYTAEKEGGTDGIKEHLISIEKELTVKFQTLKSKLDDSESRLSDHISDQFERLRGDIFALQQENDSLKIKLEDTEDSVEDLQDEMITLKNVIQMDKEKINDLEQYQRRDSVRFLGVGPESGEESLADCEQKVLRIIRDSLHLVHISADDINIAHRVGLKSGNKPRPIIVKFMSRKTKAEVIQKRKLLKGSHRGIVEDLTPLNMKRLTEVKNHPNVKNCWTKEGTIHAQLSNDRIVKIIHGNFNLLGEPSVSSSAQNMATSPAPMEWGRKVNPMSRPLASTPRQTRQTPRRQLAPRSSRSSYTSRRALPGTSTGVAERRMSGDPQPGERGGARQHAPSPSRPLKQHSGRQAAADNQQASADNRASAAAADSRASAAAADNRAPGAAADNRASAAAADHRALAAAADNRAPGVAADNRASAAAADNRAPGADNRAPGAAADNRASAAAADNRASAAAADNRASAADNRTSAAAADNRASAADGRQISPKERESTQL